MVHGHRSASRRSVVKGSLVAKHAQLQRRGLSEARPRSPACRCWWGCAAGTQAEPNQKQPFGMQAKRLAGYAAGWQTLMHGLAQPIMDDTSVEQHLKVGA